MWSHDKPVMFARLARAVAAMALAASVAGCLQPLYGARAPGGGSAVRDAMAAVDVLQIEAPKGTSEARIAVELRNALVFELTGGGGAATPTHSLKMRLLTTRQTIIVDITSGRSEAVITGLDVGYSLIETATGKIIFTDKTFARVSSDVPGQQQRFAQIRAYREAEDRAAKVIAEQIRTRLASYFVART